MSRLYECLEVDEETPVQYVGVYVMHWQPEWGEPEVAVREADDWLAQHDAEVRGGCAKQAPRAVEAIIENLRDRQGISNEWDHIELDIQEEIREVWVTCIDAAIREAE